MTSPRSRSTPASSHPHGTDRCGLYRTTRPLPDDPRVGEAMLVSFHDHSEQGVPVVLLPAFNVFNRWQWEVEAVVADDEAWIASMRRLPAEGFYALRAPLTLRGEKSAPGGVWPAGTLVQLGYDRAGGAIVFIAQQRHALGENDLWFAEKGEPLRDAQLDMLEPLSVYEEPDPTTGGAEKKG